MKYVLLAAVLAACTGSGVSSMPASTASWDSTLDEFTTAHCAWNWDCNDRPDTGCPNEVKNIMAGVRTELAAGTEDDCIACMQAWTEVYKADTTPACITKLSFDQQQQTEMACMVSDCVEIHDLPGSSPFGQ